MSISAWLRRTLLEWLRAVIEHTPAGCIIKGGGGQAAQQPVLVHVHKSFVCTRCTFENIEDVAFAHELPFFKIILQL
jgi:hypothetical protein